MDVSTPDKSEFAYQFLAALRSRGNLQNGNIDNILTIKELSVFLEAATPKPMGGKFGNDMSNSNFLFIDKNPSSKTNVPYSPIVLDTKPTEDRSWVFQGGKFALFDSTKKQLTGFDFEEQQPFRKDGWTIVRKNGSYYFMKKDGITFSEGFDWLYPTNNGLFKVKKGAYYTFVDSIGQQSPKWGNFKYLRAFINGLATFVDTNNKCGFVNSEGEIVINPIFDAVSGFNAQYKVAAATQFGKTGLINEKGAYILNPEYDNIGYISRKGLAVIVQNNLYGLVNIKGKVVLQPQYNSIRPFYLNGYAPTITKDNKIGLVNAEGRVIIEPKYDFIGLFNSKGIVTFRDKNFYGLIDTLGREILPAIHNIVGDIDDLGYIPCSFNGKIGYIDTTENFVIPPQFEAGYGFNKEGIAVYVKNNKFGFIDRTGKVILTARFDGLTTVNTFGIARFVLNGKVGFIDVTGKIIIEPLYDGIDEFNKAGVAVMRKGGKVGLINTKGSVIVEPQFSAAFNHGFSPIEDQNPQLYDRIIVVKDTESFAINSKGEMIVDEQIEEKAGESLMRR
jgi:hypothetical protein